MTTPVATAIFFPQADGHEDDILIALHTRYNCLPVDIPALQFPFLLQFVPQQGANDPAPGHRLWLPLPY